VSLDKITEQLSGSSKSGRAMPPVELWDPPYCGEIDIEIKANGDWFYNGTIFKRMSLVKLFASVLKKEADDYFLVTPVEKVKIRVESTPFILTQWQWLDESQSIMQVTTNLGDTFILDEQHPMILKNNGGLYVIVRRNLTAKVHRNVYYQWADIAKEVTLAEKKVLAFNSQGAQFILGILD